MNPVLVTPGDGPVVLGMPHVGTWLPADIRARLNDNGRLLADTDWHIDRLYQGLLPSATVVRATHHRYAIDLNRDPSGQSLYPGQNTTGLVPECDFDGEAIWEVSPDAAHAQAMLAQVHRPYHAALAAELERVRARHGIALLYDCHSIRSFIPRLFPGRLPDLNIGTDNGATCAARFEAAVSRIAAGAEGFTRVANGRFRGGWTTRHYGRPQAGIHAIQMELAQSAYLSCETPPFACDPDKATALRKVLGDILQALEALALEAAA